MKIPDICSCWVKLKGRLIPMQNDLLFQYVWLPNGFNWWPCLPTQCWPFISRYHMFAQGQSPTLSQHQVNIKRRFAFDRSEWKGNNRVHQGFWLTLRHHQSWDEHCTEDQAAYILIHLPLHIAPQRVIAYHCTCFPHHPSFCIALSHIAVTHKPTVCFPE